jgi:uncharacterized Tic20 family protein
MPMSESTPPPPPIEPTPSPATPDPVPYATPGASSTAAGLYAGPPPDKDSVTMGMLCHLLGIFTWFIGPLIIWLMKKDTSPFVDDQGKEALNFQIFAAIACLVCIPLVMIPCLGILVLIGLHITRAVFGVIASVESNKGVAYRYPLTIRFIK